MRIWPRRKPASPPPPVVLPSLDRLAGLIERVVVLVDEVSGAPPTARERPPEPPPRPGLPAAPRAAAAVAETDGAWLAFVASPHGYTIVDLPGALPAPGDELAVDGVPHRVVRHAPSPLPGDGRRCAFVEREEPPGADRSFDA